MEVRYRRGETIPVADALSRVCFKKGIHELGSQESESCASGYSIHFITDKSCPISMDSVKSAIRKDPTLYLLRAPFTMDGQVIGSSVQRNYGTTGTLGVT